MGLVVPMEARLTTHTPVHQPALIFKIPVLYLGINNQHFNTFDYQIIDLRSHGLLK